MKQKALCLASIISISISCVGFKMRSSNPEHAKTLAAGNEKTWHLMYRDVGESELLNALPLAEKGDVESIKTVFHYYCNKGQHDKENYWYQRFEEASKP
jgi:hypothetical protein